MPPVIIVGAGLSGLSCALELSASNTPFVILEASNQIGGRLRTDAVDGYLLDHGFQVLLTAYSECRRLLDYESLQLGVFDPGAYLWNGEKLEIVADPVRQPQLLLKALASSAGSLGDKLKVAALKRRVSKKSDTEIYTSEESSTSAYWKAAGFSATMQQSFLAPFFNGIFLEDKMSTSSRMFEFVFKCFSQGHAALPARGMQAIPQQLADRLPLDSIRLETPVTQVSADHVLTSDGEHIDAAAVVLATDMTSAHRLNPKITERPWRKTICHYYSCDRKPLARNLIALNAKAEGEIQNIAVPSLAQPAYAPSGMHLLCVSTRADSAAPPEAVANEAARWLGLPDATLGYLRSYHIPHALPRQDPGDLPFETAKRRISDGIWVCGDHRYSSSIQGALRSGQLTADSLLKSLAEA